MNGLDNLLFFPIARVDEEDVQLQEGLDRMARHFRANRSRCGNFVDDYGTLALVPPLAVWLVAGTYLNNSFPLGLSRKISPIVGSLISFWEVGVTVAIAECTLHHLFNPLMLVEEEGMRRHLYRWCRLPENQQTLYRASCIIGLFMVAMSDSSLDLTVGTALFSMGVFHVAAERFGWQF